MKMLLEILREPLVIGASIAAVLIVAGTYPLSHWLYGELDVDPIPVNTHVSGVIDTPTPAADIDLPDLTYTTDELTPEQSTDSDEESSASESDAYELTPEDEALLLEHFRETLPPLKRESPHGFGPYPDIPPDYPRQNLWDELERLDEVAGRELGRSSINHELMHRVLIKLWNQGKKAEGAVLDSDNGRVYPMYEDTVYVKWTEVEEDNGNIDRYIGRYRCHPSLKDYRDAVEMGTQPSWIKVVAMEDGGADPYSFLDLP